MIMGCTTVGRDPVTGYAKDSAIFATSRRQIPHTLHNNLQPFLMPPSKMPTGRRPVIREQNGTDSVASRRDNQLEPPLAQHAATGPRIPEGTDGVSGETQ